SRNTVELRPEALSVKAVSRWLADIFHTRSASTADLAGLIHEKTGGNPLFAHEFFRRIVDDGLVTHNKYQDRWCYDLEAIRARHYTENVVTLVLQQLEEMPEETRHLLGSIACLGGSGELEMVCRVVGMSVAEIRYALHPAVTAQLIALSDGDYAFIHDRVQEAAFALLDNEEKSRLHLTTACVLAESARQAAGNEILFRAVHHVTAALDCIQPAPERQKFRELSLLAARRARRSGDYPSALSYIQTARALGNAGSVRDVALDLEEAGCEFALGNLDITRRL
ncbi:histidine kinase, partial [Escherichia coli]|nr:histidine kinase [Escherichia coli]